MERKLQSHPDIRHHIDRPVIKRVCHSVILCYRDASLLTLLYYLISGINFLLHFVNQFHLFMLVSTQHSLLYFLHPSPLHSFTLNSKLAFLVNPFRHRSLTIDTPD